MASDFVARSKEAVQHTLSDETQRDNYLMGAAVLAIAAAACVSFRRD